MEKIIEQWKNGAPLLVVEYRSSKAEIISFVKEGKPSSFPKLTHACELGGQPVVVTERVNDAAFTPDKYIPPFKRGQQVILALSAMHTEKGVTVASGTLQAIPTK